jgi:two-component system, cell cycle sensor histidine kinase and response regulator CckA
MQQENQVVTGPPKVMIVEDEAIIARDIQLRLGRFGFAVTGTAPSAAKAFQSIEEDRPDIVLMDIRLRGEMDGVEAANVMRNRYRLPVIFLTAHADDATLRRAQMTEPFGYIVKPLGKTDMKAMLMMACHKHQMQQAAERHRAIFFRGLQDLPDAVLLADELHNVLFLNRAGEEMTGRGRQDAIGKGLPAVISLVDKAGNAVSMSLLQQTAVFGQPVRLPRGTTLIRADGERLDVTGQFTVSRNADEPAFLFLMLQDVGMQQNDILRLRQERQTIVAGELAHGIAREFFALFDLVQNTAEALREKPMDDSYRHEVDLMRDAGEIGANMSTQLSELGMGHRGSHLVDVNEYLFAAQAIIEPLCGSGIALSISSSPDVGYVLNTGHYVAQMLFHC